MFWVICLCRSGLSSVTSFYKYNMHECDIINHVRKWLFHIASILALKNSTFSPQNTFMGFVWYTEKQ